MSGTTQKRLSAKKLHVQLLRVLILSGFALLAITLALQIINIVLPAIENDISQPRVNEAWFGTITVVGVCAMLYYSAKLMRHTRRQYFSHRHANADKGEQQCDS